MLTRYEVNGKGIFHILNDLDKIEMSYNDEFDYEYAIEKFDRELYCPDLSNKKVKSFFTKKGLKKFQEPLEILIYITEKYYNKVDCIILEKSQNNKIIYKDRNQLIIEE